MASVRDVVALEADLDLVEADFLPVWVVAIGNS
jgi:hypothetical protein